MVFFEWKGWDEEGDGNLEAWSISRLGLGIRVSLGKSAHFSVLKQQILQFAVFVLSGHGGFLGILVVRCPNFDFLGSIYVIFQCTSNDETLQFWFHVKKTILFTVLRCTRGDALIGLWIRVPGSADDMVKWGRFGDWMSFEWKGLDEEGDGNLWGMEFFKVRVGNEGFRLCRWYV